MRVDQRPKKKKNPKEVCAQFAFLHSILKKPRLEIVGGIL